MGQVGKLYQHCLGCEHQRGQAIGQGSPDGWKAMTRSQCPAFSPSTLPTTPPLPKGSDISLKRAAQRKFYQIEIDVTNSYLKYLLWATHRVKRWPPGSSEANGEDRSLLGAHQHEEFIAKPGVTLGWSLVSTGSSGKAKCGLARLRKGISRRANSACFQR